MFLELCSRNHVEYVKPEFKKMLKTIVMNRRNMLEQNK